MTEGRMPGAQPSGPGPVTRGWARAHGVAVVDAPDEPVEDQPGGVVYLASLPHGPLRVLSGASAVLYRALVDQHEDPAARVAADLGVDPQDIDPEAIVEFADELVQAGLLVRRGDGTRGTRTSTSRHPEHLEDTP